MKALLALFLLVPCLGFSQHHEEQLLKLPVADGPYLNGLQEDWLLSNQALKAMALRNEKGNEVILSNGIISRSFRIDPNAATVSMKILGRQEELIRAVKPEAVITVNDFTIDVGGLAGQPNLAFLYPDWIEDLTANPLSFRFSNWRGGEEVRVETGSPQCA